MTFREALIALVVAITIFDVLAVWIFWRMDRRKQMNEFTYASRDQARRQALAELADQVPSRTSRFTVHTGPATRGDGRGLIR